MTDAFRHRHGPRALADALSGVTSRFSRRHGFLDGAVIADWPAIVGEHLADSSVPECLRFPPKRRTGGTLCLRIAHSGLALELQHLQTQLIERINGYFGYDAVARLQFVHGPIRRVPATREPVRPASPMPSMDPARENQLSALLEGVDDPELREALKSLGTAVFSTAVPTCNGRPAGASVAGPGE